MKIFKPQKYLFQNKLRRILDSLFREYRGKHDFGVFQMRTREKKKYPFEKSVVLWGVFKCILQLYPIFMLNEFLIVYKSPFLFFALSMTSEDYLPCLIAVK